METNTIHFPLSQAYCEALEALNTLTEAAERLDQEWYGNLAERLTAIRDDLDLTMRAWRIAAIADGRVW